MSWGLFAPKRRRGSCLLLLVFLASLASQEKRRRFVLVETQVGPAESEHELARPLLHPCPDAKKAAYNARESRGAELTGPREIGGGNSGSLDTC